MRVIPLDARPPKQAAKGRRCRSCGTPLSIYNHSAHCSVCAPEPDWNYYGERFGPCERCGELIKLDHRSHGGQYCAPCKEELRAELPTHVCPRCGDEKSVLDFARSSAKKSGISSWCRTCDAERCRKGRSMRKDGRPDAIQKAQAEVRRGR